MTQSIELGDLNPIQFAQDWHYIVIAGTSSPGAIAVNGIHGFERKTGWDKQAGKGTQGAKLVLKTQPPAEGSIDFQLWLPEHFAAWAKFYTLLKYDPAKKQKPDAANAVDIFHPALSRRDINRVVTASVSPETHVGKGLYIVTVEFIEWQNPPAVSIVQTTSSSKTGNAQNQPGAVPDPIGDAQQAQIKKLMQEAANTPLG